MNDQPLIIEKTFNASIEKVWAALTENDQMKEWYFKLEDFKPEVGFEFEFYGTGSNGDKFLHLCKITEVVMEKKLAYSWRYDGMPGNSLVSFELFDEGKMTRLKITHTGLERFAGAGPDFTKESFTQGWTHIAGKSLKEYVEK